jgi:hypothetical protein
MTVKNPFPWLSSVRSVLAVMIVGTYCALVLMGEVGQPDFKEIVLVALTFYFLKERKKEGSR